MNAEERLLTEQRKIDAMRQRITSESWLKVMDVARHFGVSRSTVESWPEEIRPFINCTPGSGKEHRRYHPADVTACNARLQGWDRSRRKGESEKYLAELRARLEERNEQSMRLADDMARSIWQGAA